MITSQPVFIFDKLLPSGRIYSRVTAVRIVEALRRELPLLVEDGEGGVDVLGLVKEGKIKNLDGGGGVVFAKVFIPDDQAPPAFQDPDFWLALDFSPVMKAEKSENAILIDDASIKEFVGILMSPKQK